MKRVIRLTVFAAILGVSSSFTIAQATKTKAKPLATPPPISNTAEVISRDNDFVETPIVAKTPEKVVEKPISFPGVAELTERIKKLEDELKRSADSTQSAELQRLKDQSQQIEEQNREDWQKIFELRRNASSESDQRRSQQMQTDASNLQMKLSRRGMERAKLNDKIGELEKKLGLAPKDAASTTAEPAK